MVSVTAPAAIAGEINTRLAEAAQAAPDDAWVLLAEAHVLSQPWAVPHTKVHWHMLRLAMATRSAAEVRGQLARIAVAAVGSVSGRYPTGNTGRSDVSAFEPMAVPPELQELLAKAQ